MAVSIFPTDGGDPSETNWRALNHALALGGAWTVNGFDVTVDSGLDIDIAAGEAIIYGYRVSSDATESETLTNNSTCYLWLEPDGTISHTTTLSNPGNALLLATIVTSGGAITSISRLADVDAGPIIFRTKKGTTENVASSTTLQDDDDLTAAVEPGVYRLLVVLEATWAASVGLKVAIACTATNAELNASLVYSNSAPGSAAGFGFLTSIGGSGSYQTNAGSNDPVIIDGVIALADAGTVKLQWAQQTSSATNTTLHEGSFMILERIT